MATTTSKNTALTSLVLIFGLLTAWWLGIQILKPSGDFQRHLFGSVYGVLALFGGFYGLVSAKSWGGFKSVFGRAILLLSLGLLLAEFGQLVFSFYNIVKHVEVPYPSIADIGFFGSIPLYILGALSLGKVLGLGIAVKKNKLKLLACVIIPIAIPVLSYTLFLKGYDTAGVSSLQLVLDFGYPIGQAIYVAIALVLLLSVGRQLGGVMKKPVLILLLAFVAQYVADFNFLYQSYHGTWTSSGSGYGDYLYLVAYFAMAASLMALSSAFRGIGAPQEVEAKEAE